MDKSIVTERDYRAENELRTGGDTEDSEAHRELIEDLAVAVRALEEYEAQGIEGTTSYSDYRAKRLGARA